jgi:hypothetical protein
LGAICSGPVAKQKIRVGLQVGAELLNSWHREAKRERGMG